MVTKNTYTEEFKLEAIKMVLDSELTTYQVSKSLGLNYKTLYTWIKQSMPEEKNTQVGKNRIKAPNCF